MSNSSWLSNNSFVENKEKYGIKSEYLLSIVNNQANEAKYSLSCFNLCLEKSNGNNFSTNNDCARRCSQKATETIKNFHIESFKGLEVSKDFL